jgi:hypothetical protein
MKDNKVEKILNSLDKSKFRSSFHLKDKDINYINDKGIKVICEHTYDFVKNRLAPDFISNDGKQTPMKGHPVFIAQHATATCCRSCLNKWHHIPKDKDLTENEINYIVTVIMQWIKKEYQNLK